MCEPAVLDMFLKNNKPYSQQNLCDLLAHQGHKKAAIGKALDALTEAKKINCKEFGKTKVYFPVQDGAVLNKEEYDAKQAEMKAAQQELSTEQEAVRALEQELATWRNMMTEQQIEMEAAALTEQIAALEEKLEQLSKGAVLVTAADRNKIVAVLQANLGHWRKRKAIFRNVWDAIAEGMDTGEKPAEVWERIGVDTDESVDVSIAAIESLKPAGGHKGPGPSTGGMRAAMPARPAAAPAAADGLLKAVSTGVKAPTKPSNKENAAPRPGGGTIKSSGGAPAAKKAKA